MSSARSRHFDFCMDPLAIMTFEGTFLDANRAWETALGWDPAELKTQSFTERLHPEDQPHFYSIIKRFMHDPTPLSFECRYRHQNGAYRFLIFDFSWDPENREIHISGRDCTDFRRSREAMATSQRQLEAVFSSMLEGVVAQDPNGQVVHFNQAALNILGVSANQLLGKESFHPQWRAITETMETLEPQLHPAMIAQSTGVPQLNRTLGFHKPDGEVRWVSLTAVPLYKTGEATPYQVVITFHDTTEERKAEASLRARKAEILRIVNALPVLIAYWDEHQRNVFSNDRYCEVRGRKPAEIVGQELNQIVGADIYKQAHKHIEAALRGLPQSYEIEVVDSKGALKRMVTQYLPDLRDGHVHGFFSVSTDITRLKELEDERRVFEAKFVAASKMSALGEMAAGIAHEINNPLAIIDGKTSILLSRLERGLFDQAKFSHDLKVVSDTVERIAKTVRGLLSFSRNAEGELTRATSLQKIIDGTLDLCREKMKNRGVELRVKLEKPLDLECRANQVSQILMNLVNNAYDAVEGRTTQWIAIEVTNNEEMAKIRVVDSGTPIPPEVVEKIMNPFFTTKEIGKGTGLGLSISKGLAQSHGGSLYYDRSAENTTFVLELPLKARAAVVADRQAG